MNDFESLLSAVNKINEVVSRAPVSVQDELYRILLAAYQNDNDSEDIKQRINEETENGKLLKEFLHEKSPNSNIERSLLFVYFLSHKAKNPIININAEHIQYCYSLCELTPPKNTVQSLRDCSSSRYRFLKWVQNHYEVAPRGLEFCEAPVSD